MICKNFFPLIFSLESLMVALSTTTNITCKYTAFVGVDKHSEGNPAKGIYKSMTQSLTNLTGKKIEKFKSEV